MFGTGSQAETDGRVDEAAAQWFARMHSEVHTPTEKEHFQSWLEATPEHARAYAALTRSFEKIGAFAEATEIRAMRAAALRRPHSGLRLITSAPIRAVSAAASIAACLILAVFLFRPGITPGGEFMPVAAWGGGPERGVHQTAAGVRGDIALKDGTLVTLAANTRIVANFTAKERRVRVDRGQAIFEVMPDPEHPFVVKVGNAEVVALGTVFDVRKIKQKFVVTLVEGKVKVTARMPDSNEHKSVKLKAGEQVSCERLSAVLKVDVARVISWQNGLLLKEHDPFVDFVDEFNRHSRFKLLIDRNDPELRNLRISGAFRVDEPVRVVEQLEAQGFKVWHTKTSSGNVRLRVYGRRSGDQ